MPEVIQIKLISQYHNNPLASHFAINKTREFIGRKYYYLSLKKDIVAYVKGCDIYLSLKVVKHKPYSDLQLLRVPTYC